MTINSLLRDVYIGDHSTKARYADGSGGEDKYILIVIMDGHGKIQNAKVTNVEINRGMLLVHADGVKRQKETAAGSVNGVGTDTDDGSAMIIRRAHCSTKKG